jgi:hypothetical protein
VIQRRLKQALRLVSAELRKSSCGGDGVTEGTKATAAEGMTAFHRMQRLGTLHVTGRAYAVISLATLGGLAAPSPAAVCKVVAAVVAVTRGVITSDLVGVCLRRDAPGTTVSPALPAAPLSHLYVAQCTFPATLQRFPVRHFPRCTPTSPMPLP